MVSPLCNLWFQSILPKLSWTMNTNYSRVIVQEIHISVFFPVAVTQAAPCERPEFKRQLWTLIWHQMDQIYCPPILAVQSWNTLLPCMQNCCSAWLYNSPPLPCRMAPLLHGLVIHGCVPGYCWPTDSHRKIQAQHCSYTGRVMGNQGEASLSQNPISSHRELLWTKPCLLSWLPTAGKVDKISDRYSEKHLIL